MTDFSPFDVEDDLDNHHPTCRGGCGQLADECMCNWPPPGGEPIIDGRDPAAIEHLCCKDLQIHDGPVDTCCADLWRADGINP